MIRSFWGPEFVSFALGSSIAPFWTPFSIKKINQFFPNFYWRATPSQHVDREARCFFLSGRGRGTPPSFSRFFFKDFLSLLQEFGGLFPNTFRYPCRSSLHGVAFRKALAAVHRTGGQRWVKVGATSEPGPFRTFIPTPVRGLVHLWSETAHTDEC